MALSKINTSTGGGNQTPRNNGFGNTPAQTPRVRELQRETPNSVSSASSADSWSVLSPTRVQIDVDPRRVSDGSTFSFMGEETPKVKQLDFALRERIALREHLERWETKKSVVIRKLEELDAKILESKRGQSDLCQVLIDEFGLETEGIRNLKDAVLKINENYQSGKALEALTSLKATHTKYRLKNEEMQKQLAEVKGTYIAKKSARDKAVEELHSLGINLNEFIEAPTYEAATFTPERTKEDSPKAGSGAKKLVNVMMTISKIAQAVKVKKTPYLL